MSIAKHFTGKLEHGINTMNVSDAEKQDLKLKLNLLAKPYLIGTGYSVSTTKDSEIDRAIH